MFLLQRLQGSGLVKDATKRMTEGRTNNAVAAITRSDSGCTCRPKSPIPWRQPNAKEAAKPESGSARCLYQDTDLIGFLSAMSPLYRRAIDLVPDGKYPHL
ncbi:hypothetical protein VTK73DRAFT_6911 [Phialemonium thermophilum]|uniref:Uncharacterized protein n=1 Tax=Phialemonium thermophilum TaxID=223376 RepID=A0ABR3WHK8_9PEZI